MPMHNISTNLHTHTTYAKMYCTLSTQALRWFRNNIKCESFEYSKYIVRRRKKKSTRHTFWRSHIRATHTHTHRTTLSRAHASEYIHKISIAPDRYSLFLWGQRSRPVGPVRPAFFFFGRCQWTFSRIYFIIARSAAPFLFSSCVWMWVTRWVRDSVLCCAGVTRMLRCVCMWNFCFWFYCRC